MQNNVRQVNDSEALRDGRAELVDRALDVWRVIDRHGPELPGRWSAPAGRRIRWRSGGAATQVTTPVSEAPAGIAKAYETALFGGRMDEVGRLLHRRHRLLGGRRAADRRRVAGT